MKTRLEYGLLEGDNLIRRGGAALVNNFGKTIAVITVIAAALVTFTEISFYSFDSERFTTGLFVMLICSYLMYFSLEDAGERLGEESDAYKAATERYNALRSEVNGGMLYELRAFLQDYSAEELKYRRNNLLVTYGISPTAYNSYVNGDACSKKDRKVLKKAERMRAVVLSVKALLSLDTTKKKSELTDPKHLKLPLMLLRLLPTVICTCVTVSVMLTARDGLTPGMIIEGILKLLTLPAVGIKGYVSGYRYTVEGVAPWIDTKSKILEAFLKERAPA